MTTHDLTEPSARHSSSFGTWESLVFVFGGIHNESTVLNDIWRLNLSASTTAARWERISVYAPVPLDPVRNPVAMSHTTGQALLYSESTSQVGGVYLSVVC